MGQEQSRPGAGSILLFLSAIASGGIGGFLGDILSKVFISESHPNGALWPWASAALFAGIGIGLAVHYWTVLSYGAFAKGSQERDRYNRLRTGLRAGGRIGRAYERMLRAALDATDRIVGDQGQKHSGRLTAFGLKEPAPLWTGFSYDFCLHIAFVYPLAAVFFIWVISGHVGPAESALNLSTTLPTWQRVIACAGAVIISIGLARYIRAPGWKQASTWMYLSLCGFALLIIIVGRAPGGAIATTFMIAALMPGRGFFSIFFAAGSAAFIVTCIGISAGLSPTIAAGFGCLAFIASPYVFYRLVGEPIDNMGGLRYKRAHI